MRKIVSFTHATLDGYIDDPHKWSFQYSDEELQDYGIKMTLAADALLLGRITYQGMAQAWSTRGGNPFADHVNSITKYVVASQPVDTTAWDPTVVIAGPDLLDEVSRLKQAEGGDILIWGTGRLTDALAAAAWNSGTGASPWAVNAARYQVSSVCSRTSDWRKRMQRSGSSPAASRIAVVS